MRFPLTRPVAGSVPFGRRNRRMWGSGLNRSQGESANVRMLVRVRVVSKGLQHIILILLCFQRRSVSARSSWQSCRIAKAAQDCPGWGWGEDAGGWMRSPVDCIVHPATTLLHTNTPPLSLCQHSALGSILRYLLRQDHMPTRKQPAKWECDLIFRSVRRNIAVTAPVLELVVEVLLGILDLAGTHIATIQSATAAVWTRASAEGQEGAVYSGCWKWAGQKRGNNKLCQ